jgi:hypothetical protein
MAAMGSKGGTVGVMSRMVKITPRERSRIASSQREMGEAKEEARLTRQWHSPAPRSLSQNAKSLGYDPDVISFSYITLHSCPKQV